MDPDPRIPSSCIIPYVSFVRNFAPWTLMIGAVGILAGKFHSLSTVAFIINFTLLQVMHSSPTVIREHAHSHRPSSFSSTLVQMRRHTYFFSFLILLITTHSYFTDLPGRTLPHTVSRLCTRHLRSMWKIRRYHFGLRFQYFD